MDPGVGRGIARHPVGDLGIEDVPCLVVTNLRAMARDALDDADIDQHSQVAAYCRTIEAELLGQVDFLGNEIAGAVASGKDGFGEMLGNGRT